MAKKYIFVLLGIGFLFRLFIIFSAYHGDLNNNISWGTIAVERGLKNFYESKDWPYSAPNQPPLTILIFWGSRLIWLTVEKYSWWLNNALSIFPSSFIWFWESKGMIFLIKLPSILADIGIGFLIYKYFFELKKSRLGLILAGVWLFNPVSWYNSTVWGQTDSIVNLLGLVSILAILKNDIRKCALFIVLSILFKGSLVIFLPILAIYAISRKALIKEYVIALFFGLVTIFLICFWFHPYFDIFIWLPNLYLGKIFPGEIGYLTVNAFNFWWLVDSGKTLDSVLLIALSARVWGFLMFTVVYFFVVWKIIKNTSERNLLYGLSVIALSAFLLLTRVHERYMYPLFPIATILVGIDLAILPLYVILSVSYWLNLYHLFWEPDIVQLKNLYLGGVLQRLLAITNLLSFAYLMLPKAFRHLIDPKI